MAEIECMGNCKPLPLSLSPLSLSTDRITNKQTASDVELERRRWIFVVTGNFVGALCIPRYTGWQKSSLVKDSWNLKHVGSLQFPFIPDSSVVRHLCLYICQDAVSCTSRTKNRVSRGFLEGC